MLLPMAAVTTASYTRELHDAVWMSLRVIVNKPFAGPTSLALGVVATTDTIAGSSAMVTVAAAVPMV